MFVALCSRTQQLMISLGEYNSWFGSFPRFYHHRVRLHNSLISSCSSSFALHSTRALRPYTFSLSFFNHYKSFYFCIIHVQQTCQTFVSKALKIQRQTIANFISIQHRSISPQQPRGEPDVYHSHWWICSDSRVRAVKRRDGTKTFKGNVASGWSSIPHIPFKLRHDNS